MNQLLLFLTILIIVYGIVRELVLKTPRSRIETVAVWSFAIAVPLYLWLK
jgi:hypothetical protein